jgi:RNA polymerase sigma factor (sigma-70 family)
VTVSDSATPKPGALTLPTGADLERLRGGLRIIALRALGDMDAAEDAVQEALSRAVVALADGRLDDPAKLPAYVAGIARHVCLHIVRDRKDTIPIDDAGSSATTADHPQLRSPHDALAALISSADEERLRVAFGELPSTDQQLLRLCFYEERTPAEVAAKLGEPADRVRKRKERALARLRAAFLGKSHDDAAKGTKTVAPPMPDKSSRRDNG